MYVIARTRNVRCVVEFGSQFGVSTIYLAAVIRDGGTGGRVIGTELVGPKVSTARDNLAEAGLEAHAEIRRRRA